VSENIQDETRNNRVFILDSHLPVHLFQCSSRQPCNDQQQYDDDIIDSCHWTNHGSFADKRHKCNSGKIKQQF
jgi:hypothetical protein